MPWVENKAAMKRFEVKKDEKGRPYFEVDDPAEAMHRKLHPDTGTEAEQQWPVQQPQQEAPPLIDLELAWCELIAATPITVSEQETKVDGETVDERNANLMVRELRYHLLASTAAIQRTENEDKQHGNELDKEPNTDACDEASAQETRKESETIDGHNANDPKVDDSQPKSVYGASILLKLQWEDRSTQKNVPSRTYTELGLFISDITMQLGEVIEKNPSAAQHLIDVIAFELTPLLLARYLDGVETCTTVLEDCCFALLKLCAARANPKEMHVAIKTLTSKVDNVYMEATSYLVLEPVLTLWGDVIVRIPQKRHSFLNDMIKVFDRMLPCAEAFETSFVPDEGVGVERPGRIAYIPEVLLKFFEELTKTQMRQRETDESISLQVDMLGRERLEVSVGQEETAKNSAEHKEHGKDTEERPDEAGDRDAKTQIKAVTMDWVNERAVTLAKVLQIQSMIWSRLPAPPGENRNIPKKKAKIHKRGQEATRGRMTDAQKEESLNTCADLFCSLGWTNPAVVCQIAANGLNLEHAGRHGELMKVHMGTDVRSKKERRNSLYSVAAVGQYICGSLRIWTRSRGDVPATKTGPYYDIDLSGSAFDFMEPTYALDLVMPFLSSVIMQAGIAVSLAGVVTLKAFLDRIPDKEINSFDEILRLRSGTASFGRDINIFGLAHHIGKSLSGYDDPKHRRIGYETFQTLLQKCASPVARYVLCEVVFYEASRVAVSAQLMTEMKDAVRYADVAWRGGKGDNDGVIVASRLRSRLADDCLGRYFVPRKELLGFVNALCTASGLTLFLVLSDKQLIESTTDEETKKETERRIGFCRTYARLGKDLLRSIASVAEHDRKNIPVSHLAKKNKADAVAIYQASGRTLNQCVAAIPLLDQALSLPK